jgi:uncharacterized OsmC-like protein
MDAMRTALESAIDYLSDHPDEATYTDSAATATLVAGLRVRTDGPAGESVLTDMPAAVGGTASAPSPGWLLRAAEASCVATVVAMRAAQLGHELQSLTVTVDSVSDDRGILGMDASIPAGPLRGHISISLSAAGVASADLELVARWGVDHCPVVDAVRRAIPLTVDIETEPIGPA